MAADSIAPKAEVLRPGKITPGPFRKFTDLLVQLMMILDSEAWDRPWKFSSLIGRPIEIGDLS
jgi:hypothetical protein